MSSIVSPGPLRAVLLAALGLPACGAPPGGTSPSEAAAPADRGASGGLVAVGPEGAGARDAARGRVCRPVERSPHAAVRCEDFDVEVHRDSLTPCGEPSQCRPPEVCASTPVGSMTLACRRVPRSGDACASALDCPAGETCLASGGSAPRCVVDACGARCPEGQACAMSVDRYTRDIDMPTGVAPAPSSDGPVTLGCFPTDATTYARPYFQRSPCDMQGADPCALTGGRWICERRISMRPCGRPVVIEGDAVVAREGGVLDWGSAEGATGESGSAALAARLARVAFDEHASIAAFARTIAMLSALGAPARLVAATSAALSDEVEHARQAFALAARYGAGELGPGAFPEAVAPFGSPDELAEALLVDVVVGGCVGESLAVLEAEASIEGAPAEVRAFLERVVVDESRHAALAFETARWLLERSPELAPVATRAVDEALRRFELDDAPTPAARRERERLVERFAREAGSRSAGHGVAGSA